MSSFFAIDSNIQSVYAYHVSCFTLVEKVLPYQACVKIDKPYEQWNYFSLDVACVAL